MATAPKIGIQVRYNGRTVTADIEPFLLSCTYTDRVANESDELELRFDDTDGRWSNQWMPEKGDKLNVQMYDGVQTIDCGTFEVDEIEYEGPPDVLVLRALAAGTRKALRTKNSTGHENKTLRQVAETIAKVHGLTVEGEINNVQIGRATQHRETDLAFLKRIADDFGHVFSIRDGVMTFHLVYSLEKTPPVFTVTPADVIRYSVRIKTVDVYAGAKVSSRNPSSKKVVQYEYLADEKANKEGVSFASITAGDSKVITNRTETTAQANEKAKAALHKANSKEVTGSVQMAGRAVAVAGNNFAVNGLGKFSGVYHITESRHNYSRNGYFTDLEIKRVGAVTEDAQTRINNEPQPATAVTKL